MANTAVSVLLTSVKYDIKESGTGRNAELMDYMNQFNRGILFPLLIRYKGDYGTTEWNTDETVANYRKVGVPTGCKAFHSLYCVEAERDDTATSGSATSIVLDDDASDSDDAYNSYYIRINSGTGDGQQKIITDYDGDTVTVTTNSALTTALGSATDGYIIFKSPTEGDRLEQLNMDVLRESYSTTGKPTHYAFEGDYIILGNIPDDVYVLQGWYYGIPDKVDATDDTLPYEPIFDELVRAFVVFKAMNRDEYNTQIELTFMERLEDKIVDIILSRGNLGSGSPPLKGIND